MPITFRILLKALLKLPLYLLYLLGLPTLPYLIKIHIKGVRPNGLTYANFVVPFGGAIIRSVYGLKRSKHITRGSCLIFPEGTSTNNSAVLNFSDVSRCDYCIGLRFSSSAVYVYGNWLLWLIRFLGSNNYVDVLCVAANNTPAPVGLAKAAGLPLVRLDYKDRERFIKLL